MENELREWLQAGGTVGAVLVALAIAGGGYIREWRRRPSLRLRFDPDPRSSSLDLVTVGSRPPSHWARVRIENGSGRRSAQDVEVLVTRFRLLSETPFAQNPLDTRPLRWSNAVDPGGRPVTKVTVPPGVARHCDLLALRPPMLVSDPYSAGGSEEDVEKEGAIGALAVLQIEPEPVDRRHWIDSGTYELELAVCARDVDARFYVTRIEFDGKWRSGPELWETLRIESFKEGRAN